MSNRVQTLPPTLGIKDPDVRSFLDALANAWDHRNGITDKSSPDRFITAEEFKGLASQAVVETLGSALGTSDPSIPGGPGSVGEAIAAISDEIKKSLLYQILGTPYANINLSDLQQKINLSVDKAQNLFALERQSRVTADEALTSQLTIQASQIGQNQAAITAEAQTRVNKDNAIAAAVNNIWAAIGGNNAVIQDGQLAQVNPSGAQATKWTQVQSEVIDPNTGKSKVASIRQDFTAFSDKVNNKFGSMYTVRAQVTSGGRTVVGGFGLSALDGPGGPTIDFGVRADTFWVAGLDGTADIPFIIKNGKVYMKTALIEDLTVDTIKIKNQALTDHFYISGFSGVGVSPVWKNAGTLSVFVPSTVTSARVLITCTVNWLATNPSGGGSASLYAQIGVDGGAGGFYGGVGVSIVSNFSTSVATSASVTLAPGWHTISLRHYVGQGSGTEWTGYAGEYSISATVIKK